MTTEAIEKTLHAETALRIKRVNADERVIEGWASTPKLDRQNDIVDPLGAEFTNPVPLLLGHDHMQVIGRAWLEPPTARGIRFRAEIAKAVDSATLQIRLDETWAAIKAKLYTSVSIGFRGLKSEPLPNGGRKFQRVEILELSIVAVPAAPDAKIDTVKKLDTVKTAPSPADALRLDLAAVEQHIKRLDQLAYANPFDHALGQASVTTIKELQAKQATLLSRLMRVESGLPDPEAKAAAGNDATAREMKFASLMIRQVQGFIRQAKAEMQAEIDQAVKDVAEVFGAKFAELERKAASPFTYVGPWRPDGDYQRGNFASFGGSVWHADDPKKGSRPGDGPGWTLAVKAGRDAK